MRGQNTSSVLTLHNHGGAFGGCLANFVLSAAGEVARVLHSHVLQGHLHCVLRRREERERENMSEGVGAQNMV